MADWSPAFWQGAPFALGIDILFVEPDRLSPPELARRLDKLPGETFAGLPDPTAAWPRPGDRADGAGVVSGVAPWLPAHGPPGRPLGFPGQPGRRREAGLPAYGAALGSLPALEEAAAGVGLINTPPTGRAATPILAFCAACPGRAASATRCPPWGWKWSARRPGAAARSPVRPPGPGDGGVGDHRLPTRADGQLLLHFGRPRPGPAGFAANVLDGSFAPAGFAGRFVILGLTRSALVDQGAHPLGERSPASTSTSGHRKPARRRRPAPARLDARPGGRRVAAAGLLLIVALPALRPAYAAGSGRRSLLGWSARASPPSSPGLALPDAATVIALLNPFLLLSNTPGRRRRQRRAVENALQASREAAACDAGELDAAAASDGLLPDPQALFADESRFRLAARLELARSRRRRLLRMFRSRRPAGLLRRRRRKQRAFPPASS